MENSSFLFSTLSLFILIIISCFTYLISKKTKYPYTVLLVLVWIIIYPLSKIEGLWFINDFTLSPNILFYVLLPILIFEAAYNINLREFSKSWKSITILSIFWVLISVFFIWTSLFYIFNFAGFHMPFTITLLFWWIISATDPVAVISIFKSMWAPKKLTLIFEWESLFNDWTAVAIFTVILSIIYWWGSFLAPETFFIWILIFLSMVILWIFFWWFMWFLFSKILWKIIYSEEAETTLALISCYVTFLLSDIISHKLWFVYISPIIATVVSSMVLWNYWKYKMKPKSEEYMNKSLKLFTFLSNSLIFILMWTILFSTNIDISSLKIPILLTIIIVMLARAISVYFSVEFINILKLEEHISDDWQKLLFWWGLRWVLALIMVLMIPTIWEPWYDSLIAFQKLNWWNFPYNIREFLLILTIGCIIFTTFINAPTIAFVMKKMWVDKLFNFERLEYDEWKIIANLNIIKKLNKFFKDDYLSKDEYHRINWKYKRELENLKKEFNQELEWDKKQVELFLKRIILRYALWIEKNYLERFFYNKKLDEKHFKYILNEIYERLEQIDSVLNWNNNISSTPCIWCWFEKNNILKTIYSDYDMYIIARTKHELAKKVIKDLEKLWNKDIWFDEKLIKRIIWMYEFTSDLFYKKRKELLKDNEDIVELEENIMKKYFLKQEEELLNDFNNKWIIPTKYYNKMIEEINDELYKNISEE